MIFSYNWLKDYIKGKLPPAEKVVEALTMHSFEVEDFKKEKKDFVFDVDILPDRAHDCLCYAGLARELGASLKKETVGYDTLKKEKLIKEKGDLKPIKVEIKKTSLVPRYSGLLIENIKVKESPGWLKEKLKISGIKSINNIVDLTNFVMLETNQPLHAFDYDKIKNQKIILREAKKGEKVITLDGVKRFLSEGMLVAEDKGRIIDLVGIMGGKLSEVEKGTKNIFLQAANFDRKSIYLTSKKLKHSTQASNIYSQGIDSNLTTIALGRIYFLAKKIAGSPKLSQVVDKYYKKESPKEIKLSLDYVNKLLGKKVLKKEVVRILKSLEFEIISSQKEELKIKVPTFRKDILIPEDLIEEIGRMIGFEKIKPEFPVLPIKSPEKNFNLFWERRIKDILKQFGFTEVYNYSFFGDKEAEQFSYKSKDLIELKNPVSIEQKYLRSNLTPNLIKNVQKNQKFNDISLKQYIDEIRIFELGKVFIKNNLSEKKHLTFVLAKREADSSTEQFYKLKGIVDSLFNKLGIADVWYDDVKPKPQESKMESWNKKKSAEIKVNNKELGFLGEINPALYEKMKISGNVMVCDIDFEELKNLATEEQEYQPISEYPSAVRDLAVLVPIEIKIADVLNLINITGGVLVRDVDLFDEYVGEELPEGKKNLAFHIIYQSQDKTLASKEIDEIHKKIIRGLEKNLQWEVRK